MAVAGIEETGQAKWHRGRPAGEEAAPGAPRRPPASRPPNPRRRRAADSPLGQNPPAGRRAEGGTRALPRPGSTSLQAWADTDFLLDIYNRRGFERELTARSPTSSATGRRGVADRARRRPPEADQRRLRPCGGRHCAQGRRRCADAPCPVVRHGRTARRRRVRSAAVES